MADLEDLGCSIILSFDDLFPARDQKKSMSSLGISNDKPWFGIPPNEQGQLYQVGNVDIVSGMIEIRIMGENNQLFSIYIPTYDGDGIYPIMVGRLYRLGRCLVIKVEWV